MTTDDGPPASLAISAPARLHFGLIPRGASHSRSFGGAGLMVDGPGLTLDASARPAPKWATTGPLAPRALEVARHLVESLRIEGINPDPLAITIDRAPTEHAGLGTGTTLSLAVARLILASLGEVDPSASRLAALTGRGRRSGIGLHGSSLGGLLVDGGRSPRSMFPPLLARFPFPPNWSILVVFPDRRSGLAGPAELDAFASLPELSPDAADHLGSLLLLEILPAVAEADFLPFTRALTTYQEAIGRAFSPAQGGLFSHPDLAHLAAKLRSIGIRAVGQSSWGPTLYGFYEMKDSGRADILDRLPGQVSRDTTFIWAEPSEHGSSFITRGLSREKIVRSPIFDHQGEESVDRGESRDQAEGGASPDQASSHSLTSRSLQRNEG